MSNSASSTPPIQTIGAILLGAGFSRRFGSDKRLHILNGETIAEQTLKIYREAFTHIRVITRPDDHMLNQHLDRFKVEIITAPDASGGMGYSLAAGFKNLDWDWAFVGLLDMPYLRVETLKSMICSIGTTGIIRPYHQPANADPITFGHPIGWHRRYFAQLRLSQGDQGGRPLLERHQQDVLNLPFEDTGLFNDIDRPTDIRAFDDPSA